MTTRADRYLAVATVAIALAVMGSRLLLHVGRFRLGALFPLLAAIVTVAFLILRAKPKPPARPVRSEKRLDLDWTAWLPLGPALAALGLAVAAAGLLPVWAWDAAGYHLPFVNFVVQGGSSAALPDRMPFVSSYPHNAEHLFAIWRLMLPDDTWLDAAQIPLSIVGAAATAALARRWGARRAVAVAAGAGWLAVPAVFLQLPSGYVDVCASAFLLLSIYWVLTPLSPATVSLAGIALGLFLGSKPSAPLAVMVLIALLISRAHRRVHARWLSIALALVFLLGASDYLAAIRRFGNPVWPIAVDLGPLHLPGTRHFSDLVAAGAAAPRAEGWLPWRVWRSWSSFRAPPSFDMRLGGLGCMVPLLVLPAAAFELRRRSPGVWIALAATLLGPDPATARFILAFPAVCLALSAAAVSTFTARRAALALMAVALLAAFDVWRAAPGLTGEGPPLRRFLAMSREERLRAIGPDGPPGRWIDLRRSLAPAEAIAFDSSFDLPYLLWSRRLESPVVFIADGLTLPTVEQTLIRQGVRFLVATAGSSAGSVIAAYPRSFKRLFACRAQPCAVYEVLRRSLEVGR